MSERKNSGITVRAASGSVRRVVCRSILALAALAALVFVSAGPTRAQSQSDVSNSSVTGVGTSTSNGVAPANTATVTQGASAKPAAEPAASAVQPTPQGRHEGITVHGHWTIEVRNTDGTLASRRAFDNELIDGGAFLLGNLLAGTVTPAGWKLHLVGTSPTQVPASQPGPCGTGAYGLSGSTLTFIPSPGYVDCALVEGGTSIAATLCGASNTFCTLTRTPAIGNVVNSNARQVAITLSGNFPAPNAGWVGAVASDMLICENFVPSGSGLSVSSPSTCMTGTITTGSRDTNFFTATLLPTPMQVTAAGQTVAVTLTLSFQ